MTSAYKNTSVPVSRSQESIRKLLINFGVRGIQLSEDFETRKINIRFAKEINGNMRTVNVSMTVPEPSKPRRARRTRFVRGRMVYDKTLSEKSEQ